tara:strand:- start:283 stop:489 length:207 start_codon:yes stop_codon:yes gene_type:complete
MICTHNTLSNYYQLNFQLMQHHKYSLTEIENMLPFEKDIYVTMLISHIEEENKKQEAEMQKSRKSYGT